MSSVLASLRETIDDALASYHPVAQAGRFLAWFAVTLALQIWAGASLAGWADLRSLAAGALPVAYRQWRKTLPATVVHRAVDEHEAQVTAAPPPIGPRW